MSARAIISGALTKPPMHKTSAKGTAYTLATIREGKGDEARFWSAFIFNEAVTSEFDRLQVGEPVAVAGEIDATIYAKEGGEPRVSFKITVDGVLNARRPKKQQEDKKQRAPAPRQDEGFSDDIPF